MTSQWSAPSRENVGALQVLAARSAEMVFGADRAKQLHASLTLFFVANGEVLLKAIFEVWFDGLLDEESMTALERLPEVM